MKISVVIVCLSMMLMFMGIQPVHADWVVASTSFVDDTTGSVTGNSYSGLVFDDSGVMIGIGASADDDGSYASSAATLSGSYRVYYNWTGSGIAHTPNTGNFDYTGLHPEM